MQNKKKTNKEIIDWIISKDAQMARIVKMAERARMFEPEMERLHEQVHDWPEQLKQKALSMPFSDTEFRMMGFK